MRNLLQERYYNLHGIKTSDRYLVQTRFQTKSSRISLPEVYGKGKGLDPHVRLEKQKPTSSSRDVRTPVQKPRIGQGGAGVGRKMRVALPPQPRQIPIPEPMPKVEKQLQATSQHESPVQTKFRQPIGPRIEVRQVPNYPDPLLRPPPRLPDLREIRKGVMDTGINIDFEENSEFQEGIIS